MERYSLFLRSYILYSYVQDSTTLEKSKETGQLIKNPLPYFIHCSENTVQKKNIKQSAPKSAPPHCPHNHDPQPDDQQYTLWIASLIEKVFRNIFPPFPTFFRREVLIPPQRFRTVFRSAPACLIDMFFNSFHPRSSHARIHTR